MVSSSALRIVRLFPATGLGVSFLVYQKNIFVVEGHLPIFHRAAARHLRLTVLKAFSFHNEFS